MSCFLGSGFDLKMCDALNEKEYRPIYTMYDCGICSKETDPFINLMKMIPDDLKKRCD
jgi:hypothetical protein